MQSDCNFIGSSCDGQGFLSDGSLAALMDSFCRWGSIIGIHLFFLVTHSLTDEQRNGRGSCCLVQVMCGHLRACGCCVELLLLKLAVVQIQTVQISTEYAGLTTGSRV